jgi:hypothetical protein
MCAFVSMVCHYVKGFAWVLMPFIVRNLLKLGNFEISIF